MKHILLITIASVLLVGCVPRNTNAGKALFNNVEIEKLEEIIYVLFGLIICSGPIIALFVVLIFFILKTSKGKGDGGSWISGCGGCGGCGGGD